MTHKDVSEQSQQIIDKFSQQALVESVISCIGKIHQEDDKKKQNQY